MASPIELGWFQGFSFDTHKRPRELRTIPTDYELDDNGWQIIYQSNEEQLVEEAVTYTHDEGGVLIHRGDTDDSVMYPQGGYRFTYFPTTKEYLCELEPRITIPEDILESIPLNQADQVIEMIDEMYPKILLNNRPDDPHSSLVEVMIGSDSDVIFEARSYKAEVFKKKSMTVDWKEESSYYHILARSANTLEIPSAYGTELYRVHMDARIQSSTNRDYVFGEIGKYAESYLLQSHEFDSLACATLYFKELYKKELWSGYAF